MKRNTLLALLAALPLTLAAAQEIQPINPSPLPPGPAEPFPTPLTPQVPTPQTPPSTQPVLNPVPTTPNVFASLVGVTATLSSPLTLKGKATLVFTLKSTLNNDLTLMTNRDNRQNCAFAPSLRVLKVGTREVVYPDGSGNAMLCAQDMKTDTLKAGSSVRYTRTVTLPAGEYMVEGWYLSLAGEQRVKVAAQPIRVTVK